MTNKELEKAFESANINLQHKFDIQPLILGKTKKEPFIKKNIAWIKFKKTLRDIVSK